MWKGEGRCLFDPHLKSDSWRWQSDAIKVERALSAIGTCILLIMGLLEKQGERPARGGPAHPQQRGWQTDRNYFLPKPYGPDGDANFAGQRGTPVHRVKVFTLGPAIFHEGISRESLLFLRTNTKANRV